MQNDHEAEIEQLVSEHEKELAQLKKQLQEKIKENDNLNSEI